MVEIFIPYTTDCFGCDSEGMFVIDEVVEWLWSKDRVTVDDVTVKMIVDGGVFRFVDSNDAIMFKLRWGGS